MLWKKSQTCTFCGNKTHTYPLATGEQICRQCMKKAGYIPGKNTARYLSKALVDTSLETLAVFSPDKAVGNVLAVDTKHELWNSPAAHDGCHRFKDLAGYRILEDASVLGKSSNAAGAAAWVGRKIGKDTEVCDSLRLQIRLQGAGNPVEYINFVIARVDKTTGLYRSAKELLEKTTSHLDEILASNKNQ